MPKLKDDAIDQGTLSEYLATYSDFGFELSVLKMLRGYDIDCEHGGHYEDPVTGKSREFDIRATKTIGRLRIRMAIECKNIRANFPILISCVLRQERESYHQIAWVSELNPNGMAFGPHRYRASIYSLRGGYSFYPEGGPVGKSTSQVGRDTNGNITANDSELFDKWGQCLGSSNDLVAVMYRDGSKDDPENTYISSVIPFVVVPNERLWVVNYDNDGNQSEDPSQIDRCPCFIGKNLNP